MPNAQENCSKLAMRIHARFILPAITLFLCSSVAMASCLCKPSTEVFGECTMNSEVCGCLEKTEWEYSAEVEHPGTGFSCRDSSQEGAHSAVGNAVSELFQEFPQLVNVCFPRGHTDERWNKLEGGQGQCMRCDDYHQYTEDVGECQVNIETSFCVPDTGVMFSATAEETESGKTGDSSGQETEDDAVDGAISDLFRRYPELASQCFPS